MASTEPAASEETTPLPGNEGSKRRDLGRIPFVIAAVGILVLATAIFVVVGRGQGNQTQFIRVTGIPSTISTPLASLMALSPVPASSAPAFVLTDQHGRTLALRSFRGDAIVLEFMDSRCVDICPIVSQEFVDAFRDLGSTASRVVFLGINVNKYHAKISDVAAFSTEHQLNTIPSWHFFTGSPAVLPSIWRAYGVDVVAPSPNADIIHSSLIFFIDPQGKERYIADPATDHTAKGTAYLPAGQLASWGEGIALVARSLVK